MKNILVIVESLDINDSSATKGRISLINNLSKCGFKIKAYHYTRKEVDLKANGLDKIECISIVENKINFLYLLSRIERLFTRITKISLNRKFENWFGFSFTFLNDSNSIAKAVKANKDFEPDLVLTLSKGASFRPHHALLKLPKLHHKWMAYIHDPYPFHFYPRPYNWIQPGYAQKEKFFREVSEKAKFSAFPSQLLKQWMGSYFQNFLKTGIIIPHQIENINLQDVSLPDYFDPKKFNLLHAGNLMKTRSPIPLLESYKKFLEKYPSACNETQLLLLGPASFFKDILQKLQIEIPTLIIENRNVPFKEVLALQKVVDVNIILESVSEISPFLPGKFPHCIASNKSILLLGPYYSETRRLLGNDYDYWSEANDENKIFLHIEKLYLVWKNEELKELNRTDLEDYLSEKYLQKTFRSLL